MVFCSLLIWLSSGLFPLLVWADEAAVAPSDRAAAIMEANRLLEEELKLAARPHIYMVLDLPGHAIVIKNRGIELHRLAIVEWRRAGEGTLSGVFRLHGRPSVNRPKAGPGDTESVPAIELQHMPDRYELTFHPGLTIIVGQSARERPWPWIQEVAQAWWHRIAGMLGISVDGDSANAVRVHLTLAQETARSLAWTLTDGMPLIVGHSALP